MPSLAGVPHATPDDCDYLRDRYRYTDTDTDHDCDGPGECQIYAIDHEYDLRILHVAGCRGSATCTASAWLLFAAEIRLRDARRTRTGFVAAVHYAESVRAKLGLPTHTR